MQEKNTCEKKDGYTNHQLDYSRTTSVPWKESDEGTKYPWNKVGEEKCKKAPCKHCGAEVEYMTI